MCKSISDIEVRFPELRYSEEKGKIVCSVCDGEISYPVDEERDFRDKKSQSMKFIQLKYKISLHVKRNNHLKNISTSKAKEDIEHKKLVGIRVGMILGRAVYYDLYHGIPKEI